MKFSVLTPVFNGAATLEETSRSLLGQDFGDWEWIIVDDGSQDGTAQIADRLSAKDPRIRVFHQQNSGVSVARNRAMAEAKGEWIAWLDADDAYTPDALSKINSILESHPGLDALEFPYLLKGSPKIQNSAGAEATLSGEQAFQRLYVNPRTRGQHWQPWRFVFRHDRLPQFRPGVIHEDLDVLPAHILTLEKVHIETTPFYIYTPAREGAATQAFTAKRVADILDVTERNWLACPKLQTMLTWNLWGYYQATENFPPEQRAGLLERFRKHPEYLRLPPSQIGRNPGLDAARIIAMFLVVLQHIIFLGGIANDKLGFCARFQARTLETASQCCVDIFGLITGFVMAQVATEKIPGDTPFLLTTLTRWKNFARLWIQVWMTGLIVLAACWISARIGTQFSSPACQDWLRALLPLCKDEYWYFTGYFFVFLLIPVLTKLACFPWAKWLALALFAGVCGICALPGGNAILPLKGGYSAPWLILLAFWGMVIHNTCPAKMPNRKHAILWFGIALAFLAATAAQQFLMALSPAFRNLFHGEWTLHHYTSPTIVLGAVAILMACSAFPYGNRARKIIFLLAPCAFGVYLLHVQPFFFEHCFKGHFAFLADLPGSAFGIATIVLTLAIVSLCICIEKFRQALCRLGKKAFRHTGRISP